MYWYNETSLYHQQWSDRLSEFAKRESNLLKQVNSLHSSPQQSFVLLVTPSLACVAGGIVGKENGVGCCKITAPLSILCTEFASCYTLPPPPSQSRTAWQVVRDQILENKTVLTSDIHTVIYHMFVQRSLKGCRKEIIANVRMKLPTWIKAWEWNFQYQKQPEVSCFPL